METLRKIVNLKSAADYYSTHPARVEDNIDYIIRLIDSASKIDLDEGDVKILKSKLCKSVWPKFARQMQNRRY